MISPAGPGRVGMLD